MIMGYSSASNVPPLFQSLSKIISGDIDCSHLCLHEHSTDGSPYFVRPQAVLYPKTTADIKHAIAFAREYQIPLTCAGGMTAGSGGALSEGIILDMTRYFSHIKGLSMLEQTVTVDAGVTLEELRTKLAGWNMELPFLQEENSSSTVGGFVATKSATASTFYTGTVREWVEAITVVVDSGEEHAIKDGIGPSGRLLGIYQAVFPLLSEEGPTVRASRREQSDDATGYSLWNMSIGPRQLLDQIVGSEGTLAIITSITFRVVQKKKHISTLLIPVESVNLLETSIQIAKHHRTESLFLFDATFRRLTDTFHPGLLDAEVSDSPYFLLASFKDDDIRSLHDRVQAFKKVLPSNSSLLVEEKKASKLSSYSFLHSLFESYFKGSHILATSCEGIIVSSSAYNECVKTLDTQLSHSGRLYIMTGYAGSGHLSITCAFDAQSSTYETDLQKYREDIFSTIQTWKGGISAVGGDGLERTASHPYIFNEATRELFKKLKHAWDPSSLFNPSKKTYISKDYLIQHTSRVK